MRLANRMKGLSQAVFCEMLALASDVSARGVKVIDLGIGSPDGEPAAHIRQAFMEALQEPSVWGYPMTQGSMRFRQAVAHYYERRFGVIVNPVDQVHSLMGSQDGLAHLALALVDPGDVALMPDPGYPIYTASIAFAGGAVHPMQLKAASDYLPDFGRIPSAVARSAKLMILNYPNNPLSVTADISFLREAVRFAREHDIVLCYDNAYCELAFDGYIPPSILEIPEAWECCVEFGSLSKSFSMAGVRIAYAVGNPGILKALSCIKSHADYGVFAASQAAAVAALEGPEEASRRNMERYRMRRDYFIDALARVGWPIAMPKATMFVWARVPVQASSTEFAKALLREEGVLVIPGNAFGAMGEGYVRMALVHGRDTLEQAVLRVQAYLNRHS